MDINILNSLLRISYKNITHKRLFLKVFLHLIFSNNLQEFIIINQRSLKRSNNKICTQKIFLYKYLFIFIS